MTENDTTETVETTEAVEVPEPQPADRSLFPAVPFIEAGLADDEAVHCAMVYADYDDEAKAQVWKAAEGSLTKRKAAVKDWRQATASHAIVGLPGSPDSGPASLNDEGVPFIPEPTEPEPTESE